MELRKVVLPLLFFSVLLILWDLFAVNFDIPPYLLPRPLDVWQSFILDPKLFGQAMWLTFLGALTGFLTSLLIGLLMAYVLSRSLILKEMISPYAVFFQTVPIVAIAPLIIVWLGTGFMSVVAVVFIVSLFPVLTNGNAGFGKRIPLFEDMLSIYNITGFERFRRYDLPLAIPEITSGAKIAAGLSVVGAIIGEFFAGFGTNHFGLGYLIIVSSGQLKTADLFVAVICSTVLGMIFISLIYIVFELILKKYQNAH